MTKKVVTNRTNYAGWVDFYWKKETRKADRQSISSMKKPLLDWETFQKVDIRVGTIIEALPFPNAKRPAYRLKIDFGGPGILRSSAQITTHYSLEELVGRQVVAVVNFPPKQVANFMSECLILGAYAEDGSVILLKPDTFVRNGSKIG